MIGLGILLIVLGLLLPALVPAFAYAHICLVIGVILLVVGLALMLMGRMDTPSAAAATTTERRDGLPGSASRKRPSRVQ